MLSFSVRSFAAASSIKIDRLVGQEPVGDVAMREHGGGDQRGVLDADAVVHLVLFAQAAQNGNGVLDARLVDLHGLEAPFERGVLLDVFAVFVERGRADAVEFAARQHRLEHVARVHRALGLARADHGVNFVDEEDDLARRLGHFLQHGLEPLLEFAPEFRPGDERGEIERDDLLVLQAFRHVLATMRWARPSTMAVLPTPGSPMRTGLFLVRRERTWMARRISCRGR
jgi:hypothetical protein